MKITKLIASVLATTILASFAVIPANAAKPDLSANKTYVYLKASGAGGGDNYTHYFKRNSTNTSAIQDNKTNYRFTLNTLSSTVGGFMMYNDATGSSSTSARGKFAHHRFSVRLTGSGKMELRQRKASQNYTILNFTTGGNINVEDKKSGNVQYGPTKQWEHNKEYYIDEVYDVNNKVTYLYIDKDLYAKYPAASSPDNGQYQGIYIYVGNTKAGDYLYIGWGDQPFNSANETVAFTYYNDTQSKTITLNDVIQDAGLGTAYESEVYNADGSVDPYKYNSVADIKSAWQNPDSGNATVTDNGDGSYTCARIDGSKRDTEYYQFIYLLSNRYTDQDHGATSPDYTPYLGYRYADSPTPFARYVRFSFYQQIANVTDSLQIRARTSISEPRDENYDWCKGENRYAMTFNPESNGEKTRVGSQYRTSGDNSFILDIPFNSKMKIDIVFDNETGLAYYFVNGSQVGAPCQLDATSTYQICDLRFYGTVGTGVTISDFVTTLYTDGKNLDELSAEIAEKHIYWDSASDKNYLTTSGNTTSIAVTPKTVWDGAAKAANAKVFIAAYNEDENYVTKFISSKNYVSGATNPDVANIGTLPSGTAKVKAFVWDWNTMKSLAKPNIFSVTNN